MSGPVSKVLDLSVRHGTMTVWWLRKCFVRTPVQPLLRRCHPFSELDPMNTIEQLRPARAEGAVELPNNYVREAIGLGTTFLPIRFDSPPEITFLTLRSAAAAPGS